MAEADDTSRVEVEDELLRRGFTAMPNMVLGREDIGPGPKLVYLGLLHYAWQAGSCFPGQERLGLLLGMSERSVRNHLRELEGVGLVVTLRRGLNKTNVYRLPKVW